MKLRKLPTLELQIKRVVSIIGGCDRKIEKGGVLIKKNCSFQLAIDFACVLVQTFNDVN